MQTLSWLKPILGGWLTPEGKIDPEFYLALVTMHGTIMVFFVLTAGLSGTFSNFLIPLQIGARDMASGFMNMLSYWFFFVSSVIMFVLPFPLNRSGIRGLGNLSAIKRITSGYARIRSGHDVVVGSYGDFYCKLVVRKHQLYLPP
jgi:hypothetical protein